MKAPERISIHPTERCPVSKVWKRGKWKDHDSGASGDVGYIRADLHDAEIARLTAERDALEPQPITVQDAARVLLTALERAQIDMATLKLFFNGQPVAALRAIAEQEGR